MAKKIFWITAAVVAIMALVALSGCRTQYIPRETVRIEYREADTAAIFNRLLKIFESRSQRESGSDSLLDRTKEIVVLDGKGDTARHDTERIIYRSSRHEKELERKVIEQDSVIGALRTALSSVKADSIAEPVPVGNIPSSTGSTSWWRKLMINLGAFAGGLAFGVFIGKVIKLARPHFVK